MKRIFLIISALALATVLSAQTTSRPMNVTVIQPAYENGEEAAYRCHRWMIEQLDLCTPNDDIIVLPESSTQQARFSDTETCMRVFEKNYQEMIDACSRTAKRCDALVFMNGYGKTETGVRNITFAFGRDGKMIGMYPKQQLVASEWKKMKLDRSYMMEWNEPYYLDIDGLRYAFLTCYDFYYYENYSNIARYKPDIIIGCSHQRSDPHHILEFIDSFCAYNTGAYLIRASVSMGLDSPVGGSSMIVAPDGNIIGNMKSRVGRLTATIDPLRKYLKPAGFGNPLATHPEYVEIGRRPWKYRQCGSAIVPGFEDTENAHIAVKSYDGKKSMSTLASFGAAVAMGAPEIVMDLHVADGKVTVGTDSTPLESVMKHLACHALMYLRLDEKSKWDSNALYSIGKAVKAFDAEIHVCIASSDPQVHQIFATACPKVARCIITDDPDTVLAAVTGVRMIELPFAKVTESLVRDIHSKGMKCAAEAKSTAQAKQLKDLGTDVIIVPQFLAYR